MLLNSVIKKFYRASCKPHKFTIQINFLFAFSLLLLTAGCLAPTTTVPEQPVNGEPLGQTTLSAQQATGIFAADLNGDGDQDVLATEGSQRLVWYPGGDEKYGFGFAHIITFADMGPHSRVLAADLDQDGDQDALLAIPSAIVWFENKDGKGDFVEKPFLINTAENNVYSVFTRDLDGDDDMDVLAYLGPDIVWFENTDNGASFVEHRIATFPAENGAVEVLAVDMDGDGDQDVLAAASNRIGWFENENGLFGALQKIEAVEDYDLDAKFKLPSFLTADFDGDGDQDLVVEIEIVSAPNEFPFMLFKNNGQGVFDRSMHFGSGHGVNQVAADLDGDKDPDLLKFNAGKLTWLLNQDGTWVESSAQHHEAGVSYIVQVADIDGDGDPDALLQGQNGSLNLLWIDNNTAGKDSTSEPGQLFNKSHFITVGESFAAYNETYAALPFTRLSTLSLGKRQEIVRKNMPIWIMNSSEDYYPKAFQEYLAHDIKGVVKQGENKANLMAYSDLRHHKVGGQYNTVSRDDHLMDSPYTFVDKNEIYSPRSMDPKAAPTYAFYLETETGEVWIRYFLFFSFNSVSFPGGGDLRVPGLGDLEGDHFGDWIHISVKLQNQGGEYVPTRYYFSAHTAGSAFTPDDPRLDYYLNTGPSSFQEVEFADAKSKGEYHVRVFIAHGTHETYAERGNHHSAIDHTDFGNFVLVPMAWDVNPAASSNSTLHYPPYYAWDMSALRTIDRDSRWDSLLDIPYASKIPLDLFYPLWDTFTPTWFLSTGSEWKAILDSGQKDAKIQQGAKEFTDAFVKVVTFGQVDLGLSELDFSATVPVQKIFDWKDVFDK